MSAQSEVEGDTNQEEKAVGGGTDRNLPGAISLNEAETTRLQAELAELNYRIGSVRLQFLRQLFWLPAAIHWSTTVRILLIVWFFSDSPRNKTLGPANTFGRHLPTFKFFREFLNGKLVTTNEI